MLDVSRVKALLDKQRDVYCNPDFIADDPIQIPHLFDTHQNIEIAGFFAASFAWGQRKTIINKAKDLIRRMDGDPFDFVVNHSMEDLKRLLGFRHRTFGEADASLFVKSLAEIYRKHKTMDELLVQAKCNDPYSAICKLRSVFETVALRDGNLKGLRHIANINAGSASKRLNMFFRWMVRTNQEGVDFGLWTCMKPSQLLIPLDVHVGNVARELGILKRKQNDIKAVEELTSFLRLLDGEDPVKYDFALFSMDLDG